MASVRQRQAPRKPYKVCGPVGEKGRRLSMQSPLGPSAGKYCQHDLSHCKVCGYHVCSCPPKRPAAEAFGCDGVFRPEPGVTYEFPSMPLPPKADPRPMTIDWPAVRAELRRLEAERHAALPSPMPEPPARVPEWHGNPMPRSMVGRLALLEALAARDPEDPEGPPVFSPEQCAQAIELLLRGEAEGP
jgi:hypothetical protein